MNAILLGLGNSDLPVTHQPFARSFVFFAATQTTKIAKFTKRPVRQIPVLCREIFLWQNKCTLAKREIFNSVQGSLCSLRSLWLIKQPTSNEELRGFCRNRKGCYAIRFIYNKSSGLVC
jgi:hypothetical protein